MEVKYDKGLHEMKPLIVLRLVRVLKEGSRRAFREQGNIREQGIF